MLGTSSNQKHDLQPISKYLRPLNITAHITSPLLNYRHEHSSPTNQSVGMLTNRFRWAHIQWLPPSHDVQSGSAYAATFELTWENTPQIYISLVLTLWTKYASSHFYSSKSSSLRTSWYRLLLIRKLSHKTHTIVLINIYPHSEVPFSCWTFMGIIFVNPNNLDLFCHSEFFTPYANHTTWKTKEWSFSCLVFEKKLTT